MTGILRTVSSRSDNKTTYFLRATYVPRYIWEMRFFVKSAYPFTEQVVAAEDGGLCSNWILTETEDAKLGGRWIDIKSPNPGQINTPITFAAFGPVLHFEVTQAAKADAPPFEVLYVDNSIYPDGQSFTIQDWKNELPVVQQ